MMMMFFLGLLRAAGAVAAATAAPFSICTCASDPSVVQLSAADLQSWLSEHVCPSLSFSVENITSKPPESTSCLAVGPCAANLVEFFFPSSVQGEEAFAFGPTGNGSHFAVTGIPTSRSQRGTAYASTKFVEGLGVKFLTSKFTTNAQVCPNVWLNASTTKPFVPASMPSAYAFSPPLEYRQNLFWDFDQNPKFAAVSGANSPASLPGGGISYASPPGFVHTSYALVNITELYDSHPEWFWPRNKTVYGQLCWSNASLVDYVVQRVKTILKTQPGVSIISVSQNDNYNYCNSSAERAIYAEEGGVGIGPLLRAVNTVAEAIETEFSSVSVDTLAYQWTRAAPTKTVPRKNVIIRLCSIECNFGVPLSDPSNKKFQTDIVNWGAIFNRIFIWNYVTDFANYVMPWPDWYNIAPNTEFYLKHGVTGLFQEGSYQSYGGDMGPLKGYLNSKMMFDPSLDSNAVIDEFLLAYFDAAAPYFKEYLDLWASSVKTTSFYLSESVSWNAGYLTPTAVLLSGDLMKTAETRVANTPVFLQHTQMGALPTLYVALLRWDELNAYLDANPSHFPVGFKWPWADSKADAFAIFSDIYNKNGITHLNEGGHDLKWLQKQIGL